MMIEIPMNLYGLEFSTFFPLKNKKMYGWAELRFPFRHKFGKKFDLIRSLHAVGPHTLATVRSVNGVSKTWENTAFHAGQESAGMLRFFSLRLLIEAQNPCEFIGFLTQMLKMPMNSYGFWTWCLEYLWIYKVFRLQINGPNSLRLNILRTSVQTF